jgi:hypothetical protein
LRHVGAGAQDVHVRIVGVRAEFSPSFAVYSSMSTGSNFMLTLIAAASSSMNPPRGPVMNTTLWIPSVIDEPGSHWPVSAQM